MKDENVERLVELFFGQRVETMEEIGQKRFMEIVELARRRGGRNVLVADGLKSDLPKFGAAIRQGINQIRKDGRQVFRAVAITGGLVSKNQETLMLPSAQLYRPEPGLEARLMKFAAAQTVDTAGGDPDAVFAVAPEWSLPSLTAMSAAGFDWVGARKVPQSLERCATSTFRGQKLWWGRQRVRGYRAPESEDADTHGDLVSRSTDDIVASERETTLALDLGKSGISGRISRRHAEQSRQREDKAYAPAQPQLVKP